MNNKMLLLNRRNVDNSTAAELKIPSRRCIIKLEEKVLASQNFDKTVLIAAHMAALHDAYILEIASPPTDPDNIKIMPPSPTTTLTGLKPCFLKQLKVGKVHRKQVLHGTLCVKTLCLKSSRNRSAPLLVNLLEDEQGNATPIHLCNTLEGNIGSVRAQSLYPQSSKVAVREPYLTHSADGQVILLVEKVSDLVFLWVPEHIEIETPKSWLSSTATHKELCNSASCSDHETMPSEDSLGHSIQSNFISPCSSTESCDSSNASEHSFSPRSSSTDQTDSTLFSSIDLDQRHSSISNLSGPPLDSVDVNFADAEADEDDEVANNEEGTLVRLSSAESDISVELQSSGQCHIGEGSHVQIVREEVIAEKESESVESHDDSHEEDVESLIASLAELDIKSASESSETVEAVKELEEKEAAISESTFIDQLETKALAETSESSCSSLSEEDMKHLMEEVTSEEDNKETECPEASMEKPKICSETVSQEGSASHAEGSSSVGISNDAAASESKPSAEIEDSELADGMISAMLRARGNLLFSQGDFAKAAEMYTGALVKARATSGGHTAEEVLSLSNRAEVWLRLDSFSKALEDSNEAIKLLELNSSSVKPKPCEADHTEADASSVALAKALFRKGRALMGLERFEEAMQALQQVEDHVPGTDPHLRNMAIKCRDCARRSLKNKLRSTKRSKKKASS